MTIKEFHEMTVQLSASVSSTIESVSNFLDSYESIMPKVLTPLISPDLSEALSNIQKRISYLFTDIDSDTIQNSLTSFEQIQSKLLDTVWVIQDTASSPIIHTLTDTLEQADPYLPPDIKEECENNVLPKLKNKRKLTLSEALSIFSALFAIFVFLVSLRPNEQLETIIAQNNTIIEQQERQSVQLQEKDEELSKVLHSLSDSINILADEIDSFREEFKNSSEVGEGSCQPDTENSQQQD